MEPVLHQFMHDALCQAQDILGKNKCPKMMREGGEVLSICKERCLFVANFHIWKLLCSFIFVGRQYCNTVADVFSETDTITKKKILTFWP